MTNLHTVEKYMSTFVQTIEPTATVEVAEEMMQRLGIRHLPVVSRGKLVGLLSESDIKFYRNFVTGVEARNAEVADVCKNDVFAVDVHASLEYVLNEMEERKLGSVVVLSEGRIAGIFTTLDALAALSKMLHQEQGPSH